MNAPVLGRIDIFPIKSLDGVTLKQVAVLPSGALQGDRQYAIVDAQGKFVNGKSNPLIHRLRASFDADLTTVTLQVEGTNPRETFLLSAHRGDLEHWLSQYFDQSVMVQENTVTGFPDDPNAPGPTVITTATLEAIAQWFPTLDVTEVRRRFRTNLEMVQTPPFWEEQLYGESEQPVMFQIGSVRLMGVNPCQRCIVPTRSSLTGEGDRIFQRQFIQQRQATLPHWAPRSRFNHFYKLGLNTCLAVEGQAAYLSIGDEIQPLTEGAAS